jgi:hypothetical protein
MELIKMPKFDHSKDTLGSVIGMSDYDQHYVKTSIIFEVISTSLLTQDLFEDPSEAPKDMTTVSGLLEKSLRHAKTPLQQMYCLLEFQVGYAHTRHGMEMIEEKQEKQKDKKVDGKDIKDEDGLKNLLSKLVDKLKTLPLQATIEEVIKCNYDFDTFVKNVIPRSNYDEQGNCKTSSGRGPGGSLDDLIRKSLGDIPGIEFMGSVDPTDGDDDDE